MKNSIFSNGIIGTMVKLSIAYLVGYIFLGLSQSITAGFTTLLIYGLALIIEAIKDVKR